jgi:S-adenosylmethionine-dependent methyltransferase
MVGMGRRDADFDPIAHKFEQDIYGSSKGRVRLEVLWRDLQAEVLALTRGGLRVLDAGGGAGHLAVLMAEAGNSVLLCDPSSEMLALAQDEAERRGLAERITTFRCAIQDLASVTEEKFDLVTCHAVLEWLADPREAVTVLAPFVKPGGRLSLMFYNRNAAVFKRLLRGDFGAGDASPEDAPVPLDEAAVTGWLEEAGLRVVSRSGIRILHDHLRAEVNEDNIGALIEAEWRLRKREPFASLAQHIHLVCARVMPA